MISPGDLAIDLDRYVSPPGRIDQFTIFFHAAARLEVLKKIEIIRKS